MRTPQPRPSTLRCAHTSFLRPFYSRLLFLFIPLALPCQTCSHRPKTFTLTQDIHIDPRHSSNKTESATRRLGLDCDTHARSSVFTFCASSVCASLCESLTTYNTPSRTPLTPSHGCRRRLVHRRTPLRAPRHSFLLPPTTGGTFCRCMRWRRREPALSGPLLFHAAAAVERHRQSQRLSLVSDVRHVASCRTSCP